MVSVVEQNRNLRNVNRFSPKVIQIAAQQLNQSLVVGNVGFSAMGEEWESQSINGKMAFDTVGALVVTKAFGGKTGIACVFNCL